VLGVKVKVNGYVKTQVIQYRRWFSNQGPLIYNLLRAVNGYIDWLRVSSAVKKRTPFVVVYQQGRVASTSVYESLKLLGLPNPIYHVHTLSEHKAKNEIAQLKQTGGKVFRHYFLGQKLAQALKNIDFLDVQKPWKIISIFRDPIEIMLSLYFLNIEDDPSGLLTTVNTSDKDYVLKFFKDLLETSNPAGWDVCNWYDDVFFNELGVDVYKSPFDKEKGYSIINTKRFDILLIRFEGIQSGYSHGVAELFDLDASVINLEHTNLHRTEQYSDIHKYIKKNLKLSRSFCEKVYATKIMKSFYSPEHIEELTKKWTREI